MDHTINQHIGEEIALLTLLCDVPERPSHNTPPANIRDDNQGSRALTFERERDIVDNLAFLAAADEDPNSVIAVCVEELEGSSGLKVILAVNRGSLATVKDGFDRIFRTLKDVPPRGESTEKDDVIRHNLLMEILSLNHNRLLCRLRSRHARGSSQNSNRPALDTVVAHLIRLTSSRSTSIVSSDDSTLTECRNFQSLFRQLEAADATATDDLLVDVVRCAHRLTTQFQLERILSRLPRCDNFGSSARVSLLGRMQKVGRYQSTCEFLFFAARKVRILKHVKVEVVVLPEPTMKILSPKSAPNLTVALQRVNLTSQLQKEQLCHAISLKEKKKPDLAYSMVEELFECRSQNLHSSGRIHAEIQIIYHYEINQSPIRPRVICSSKSACFLCDLFTKTHGKFHIERTHGRLYGKWRLPAIGTVGIYRPYFNALLAILERFHNALKNRINNTVQCRTDPIHLHPNESVFIHPPTWTPSRISEVTNNEAVGSARSLVSSLTTTPTLRPEEQPEIAHVENSQAGHDEASETKHDRYSDASPTPSEGLIKGKRMQYNLSRPDQSLYLSSPRFHISISAVIPKISAKGLNQNGVDEEMRSVEIEWLSDQEEARVRNEQMSLVNVESMKGGTEVITTNGSLEAPDGLYILFRGGTVYFKYSASLG